MAAVADPDGDVDLDALAEGVDRHLPTYARPLFVRLQPRLEKTGTFKIVKVTLQKQVGNPKSVCHKGAPTH